MRWTAHSGPRYSLHCKETPHGPSISDNILAIDGHPATVRIHQVCRALPWQPQSSELLMLEPIPVHGLRTTDVSRESARHRDVSSRDAGQTLSHGHSGRGTQHVGQRQQGARLAHLCRLCASPDRPGKDTVPRGRDWCRTRSYGLRPRFLDRRFVPLAVSLGFLPQAQRGGETAYLARSTRQHSEPDHHYQRENPRRQHPRRIGYRGWGHLHHGSRLYRFRTLVCHPSGIRILRDASQRQLRFPAASILAPWTRPPACNATRRSPSTVST